MADTATLQFKADTSGINQANDALDKIVTAADRAEKAADRLDTTISGVGKGSGNGIKQTKKDVEDLLHSIDPTAKAFEKLDDAMDRLASARKSGFIDNEQFADYSRIIDQQRISLQSVYDNMTGYAQAQKRMREEEALAQRTRESDIISLNRLKMVLDPASEAARRLKEQFAVLSNAKATGLIDENTYKNLKGRLDDLSRAADQNAMSAGQVRAGWSNATQQFIDLGVQLQGGANPITALVQQGPQLAFAFGSVGNTIEAFKQQFSQVAQNFGIGAKTIDESAGDVSDSVSDIAGSMNDTVEAADRLGTGFARFITPLNVGLAALAAGVIYFGYAVYQSYKQTETLNQEIAKTGGQAGVTAQKLKDMAKSLSDATGASAENSFKAVSAAASLSRTVDELERYSRVAIVVSESTGENVDELVRRFAKLSEDPVAALKELGNEFGFISPKLYEQVKAMNEAGDRAGAYALVLGSLQKRSEEFKDGQRGSITEVKNWWQELIDKVGEYLTVSQEVPKIETPSSGIGSPVLTGNVWLDNANKEMKKSQDEAAKSTKANFDTLTSMAQGTLDFVTKTSERTRQAANAAIAIDAKAPQYQLQSARIAEQMKETQRQINQIRAGGDQQALARANKLYADQKKAYDDALKSEEKKGQTKEKAVKVDAGDRALEQYQAQNLALDAQIKMLQERTSGELRASQQRKAYYELQAKFAVLEEAQKSRVLTKQEQQLLASKDQALAEAKVTAEKGDQLALLQRQSQINDEIASKADTIKATTEAQAQFAGRSTREMQRAIRDAEMLAKLTAQGATELQKTRALQANAAQDQSDDAQRNDWVNSGKTAYKDWADAATNYADIAKTAVTSAMDASASAITDFVLTGKANFEDFAKSMLKMLAEIIVKMTMVKAIQATIGGFSGLSFNADGGVYQDPSLHRYANQVHTTPQFFQFGGRSQFAKGGVFAEAGPEAIMPLSRDSSGRLGVKAEGGGGGGSYVEFNQSIHIDSNGNASAQTDSSAGKQVADQLKNVVVTEVQRMLKPGGLLFNSGRG